MSMYGTQDAAANWEHQYSQVLIKARFSKGVASPCHFTMNPVVSASLFTVTTM